MPIRPGHRRDRAGNAAHSARTRRRCTVRIVCGTVRTVCRVRCGRVRSRNRLRGAGPRRLTAALVPGSFLAINHSTSAVSGAAMEEAVAHWNQVGTPTMTLRSPQQIARFFDRLDLLEPGVVSCSRWRPDISSLGGQPPEVDEFCGVARKP